MVRGLARRVSRLAQSVLSHASDWLIYTLYKLRRVRLQVERLNFYFPWLMAMYMARQQTRAEA